MILVPPELIRSIVEQVVHASDLVVLSRVSRHLQGEAERLLYRSMTSKDGTTSFKFLSSIYKCLRRATSVRIYHVHGILHKQRRSIWNLIVKCLRTMVNLKELGFNNWILGTPAAIFPATCPFQLEKFIWTCPLHYSHHVSLGFYDGNYGNSLYDEQAISFLEGQPRLRHLRWMTSVIYPSKTVCPNLRILEGNIGTFQMFLPGTSVTTLYWLSDSEIEYPVIPRQDALKGISPQLKMIRALSFQHPDWGWIEITMGHLQSLEALEIFSLSHVKTVSLLTIVLCGIFYNDIPGTWNRHSRARCLPN
ncbi:hypothetical protein BDZ97DRAFT_118574 [Flammula alnicola]|nr:hypothetical protein BDZ97DRAFT_118574 [Flammula alnicola]